MTIVSSASRIPLSWLAKFEPDLKYEKYITPDGSRRRRKQFTEWEKLLGNTADSESDVDDDIVDDPCDPYEYVCCEHGTEPETYKVTCERIAVRKTPSLDGKVLGILTRGATLETLGWDAAKIWRKIHYSVGYPPVTVVAWVLVRHSDLGFLIRPLYDGDDCVDEQFRRLVEQECQPTEDHVVHVVPDRPVQLKSADAPLLLLSRARLEVVACELLAQPMSKRSSQLDDWEQLMNSVGKLHCESGDESDADSIVSAIHDSPSRALALLSDALTLEVVIKPRASIYTRANKTVESKVIGKLDFGCRFDVFEWDESDNWAKLFCQVKPSGKLVEGWVQMNHEDGFEILQRVCVDG